MSDMKLNIPEGGLTMTSIPVLGKPLEAKKNGVTIPGVYYVKKPALVNHHYTVCCPKCGKALLAATNTAGPFLVAHKGCKVRIKIQAINRVSGDSKKDKPTPTVKVPLNDRKQSNGKLVWWGNWWGIPKRKKYVLREGENYIGRKEDAVHSGLTLKDKYASKRSICITVNHSTENGYSFHLSVLKATNPVLVCGKEYEEGRGIDLNYGDTIVLGNTTLTFKPLKK